MALDFPASPTNGQVYDNFYYDSSMQAWRALAAATVSQIPSGVISQFAGSIAPGGYLLCTGQSLNRSDYPDLFSVIGYQYGGSGTAFSIPNLENRVPVGKGLDTEFNTLGEIGGDKTVTLTEAQMPSHTHIQNSHNHTQNSHSHGFGYQGGTTAQTNSAYAVGNTITHNPANVYSSTTSVAASNQATTATNQTAGSGAEHPNLQPYIVLNYIIKT
jgi:microcystin-dependent protein